MWSPTHDGADPAAARAALQGSGLVVAMTPFRDAAVDNADVLLPIAPFTGDCGHLRQRRGQGAELPRRRQAVRRGAAGLEGAARARQRARAAGFRSRQRRGRSRRGAGEPPTRPTRLSNAPAVVPIGAGCDAWPGARVRRADLLHRRAGAPRRRTAGHARRAGAGGRRVEHRCGANSACRSAPRCVCRRAVPVRCCRRAKIRRWHPPRCAWRQGIRPPRRSARCSAPSASLAA